MEAEQPEQTAPITAQRAEDDVSPFLAVEAAPLPIDIPSRLLGEHWRDWIGVTAIVCLAVIPDYFNAMAPSFGAGAFGWSFEFLHWSLLNRSIQVIIPTLAIVVLSSTTWASIGIVRIRWLLDILLGIGLWMVGTLVYYRILMLLPDWTVDPAASTSVENFPGRWNSYLLLIAASAANAFAEELVIRGYLLTRFERLFGSPWLALATTSLMFASYHIYQGLGATIGIASLGVMFGGTFLLCRRLWPCFLAHMIMDILSGLMA